MPPIIQLDRAQPQIFTEPHVRVNRAPNTVWILSSIRNGDAAYALRGVYASEMAARNAVGISPAAWFAHGTNWIAKTKSMTYIAAPHRVESNR